MGFNNLGIALGSGVDEFHRGQEQARRDAELKLRQEEAARQAERQSWEALDQKEKIRVREAGQRILDEYNPMFEKIDKGEFGDVLPQLMSTYNSGAEGHNDGFTSALQSTPQGTVVSFMNKDGKVAHTMPVTRDTMRQAAQASMIAKLSAISPSSASAQYNEDRKYGLEGRKIAVQERGNDINDSYRQGMLGLNERELEQRWKIAQMEDARRRQQIEAMGGGSANLGQLLGPTTDGKGLVYNTQQGLVTRPLPDNVDVNQLFPKATGARATRAISPELEKAMLADYANVGTGKGQLPTADFLKKWPMASDYFGGPTLMTPGSEGREPGGTPAKGLGLRPDITKRTPAQELGRDIFPDPMTNELITAPDYYRKYRQWPEGTPLTTRLLGR